MRNVCCTRLKFINRIAFFSWHITCLRMCIKFHSKILKVIFSTVTETL